MRPESVLKPLQIPSHGYEEGPKGHKAIKKAGVFFPNSANSCEHSLGETYATDELVVHDGEIIVHRRHRKGLLGTPFGQVVQESILFHMVFRVACLRINRVFDNEITPKGTIPEGL